MKKTIVSISVALLVGWSFPVLASDSTSHSGKMEMSGSEMDDMSDMKSEDTFMHHVIVDGIRADVKIMSLASMNMKDSTGATHHIMLEFRNDATDAQIKDAVGRVKVIGPDKKEQSGNLKNYSGNYAANLTITDPGKYGVMCLVKVGDKKHLFKFWYPHGLPM